MKLPKANLRDISVEKVAPDVISALFLVSLVRKLYGNRKAVKQLQRLILENKPVDSEKFIRANFKLGIPMVIITKSEHVKERFAPALRRLNLPKEKVDQVVQRAFEIFPLVLRGNGFASLIADERGEKKLALVAVPPKANPFLMKHEMGHILYRLKEGRPMIKGFKITVEPFLQSLSFLSRIYSKKSKYGIEKEEGIAWDIAGVPKDNPLRQASQKTYETSMGFAASGLKWVLASAFSPYIIQLAGKLKSMIHEKVLKEDSSRDKEIRAWIKKNVPKKMPDTPGWFGRCSCYAAAMAVIFGGQLIMGFHGKLKKGQDPSKIQHIPGDTSHFWVRIDGKDYDPTGHWYPGAQNFGGKVISVSRNMHDFRRDSTFMRLTKDHLHEDEINEKKMSKFARLKGNRKPLTPEERAEVMQKKATWHHGPGGKPSPAVWKSINPTTGEVTYVTNTHRAYQARPTLNGAISIYHRFIKSTA